MTVSLFAYSYINRVTIYDAEIAPSRTIKISEFLHESRKATINPASDDL